MSSLIAVLSVGVFASDADDGHKSDGSNIEGNGTGMCNGTLQSPINLPIPRTLEPMRKPVGFLAFNVPVTASFNISVNKTEHGMTLLMLGTPPTLVGSNFNQEGSVLSVVNIHFHTRSEHSINNINYPLEMHVVCRPGTSSSLVDSYVVVGFLFEAAETASDPFLFQLANALSQQGQPGRDASFVTAIRPTIDFEDDYFEYSGSLTTPPCTETVHWLVATTPRKASRYEILMLSNLLQDLNGGPNAREVQPLSGRPVALRRLVPNLDAIDDYYRQSPLLFEELMLLLAFLTAVWVAGQVAQLIGIPALVGELIAGYLSGPSLGNYAPAPFMLRTMGELGLLLIVLQAGADLDIALIRHVGWRGIGVALLGFAFPMGIGYGICYAFHLSHVQALSIGAALGPTSQGVLRGVLQAQGLLHTPSGDLALVASTFDMAVALLLLGQLRGIALLGTQAWIPTFVGLAYLAAFLALGIFLMPIILRRLILPRVAKYGKRAGDYVVLAWSIVLMLGLMPAVNYSRAHYLIGVFVAGAQMCTLQDTVRHAWKSNICQVQAWLVRLFFACTVGFDLPIRGTQLGDIVALGLSLVACSVGKIVLGLFASPLTLRLFLLVSTAMTARGEFSFLLAKSAMEDGTIEGQHYAACLLAILISVIAAPKAVRLVLYAYESTLRSRVSKLEVKMLSSAVQRGTRLVAYEIVFAGPMRRHGVIEALQTKLQEAGVRVIDYYTEVKVDPALVAASLLAQSGRAPLPAPALAHPPAAAPAAAEPAAGGERPEKGEKGEKGDLLAQAAAAELPDDAQEVRVTISAAPPPSPPAAAAATVAGDAGETAVRVAMAMTPERLREMSLKEEMAVSRIRCTAIAVDISPADCGPTPATPSKAADAAEAADARPAEGDDDLDRQGARVSHVRATVLRAMGLDGDAEYTLTVTPISEPHSLSRLPEDKKAMLKALLGL